MAEYIDRQAAINALWKELFAYEDAQEKDAVDKGNEAIDEWFLKVRPCVQTVSDNGRMAILELPAADVEPVKHGRWIRVTKDGVVPQEYCCDVCGRLLRYDGVPALLSICYPYCHCGARMDGEENADEITV